MYSLDQLTNACQPVTLAGKAFPVRQLKLREWGEVQAWLKSVAPSPVAVAVRGVAELRAAGIDVPAYLQDAVFHQAQVESRAWPPRAGTTPWLEALEAIEGGRALFLKTALAAGGSDISDEDADDLVNAASLAEIMDLIRVCLHGEHLVPKAAGESPPPSLTTGGNGSIESATRLVGPIETLVN